MLVAPARMPASGVPLQIWWSTRDRVVVDQAHQSGLLDRRIMRFHPRAPVYAFVGRRTHTAEMRWNRRLPVALKLFGLLRSSSRGASQFLSAQGPRSAHPEYTSRRVPVSARANSRPLLPGFGGVETGPNGGRLLRGVYPDAGAPRPLRPGFLYLPPGFDGKRRYSVVYLLHGMPGDRDEYVNSLRVAEVADRLISTRAALPFIADMPAAGPDLHYNGEWGGPWEDYLVHGVVPWVDAHLPSIPEAAGRTLAGLSAGGFGAMDIGLRSPMLFGRIESWSGYFTPLHDGPFKEADAKTLAANDPTKIVARKAGLLRRLGTRFYLGTGPTHSHWFKQQATVDFAARLRMLGFPVTLQLFPTRKGEWRGQFEAGLRWAFRPP
jgi:hypothetical protein